MDVWFVNSNIDSKIESKLKALQKPEGTKCCWTDKDESKSLSKLFTGFGRIIEYADYVKGGASPEYAYKLIEGELLNGKPHGFARVITGYEGLM